MREGSRIAIIPARGGSKRIPRKNIKEFLGKPIIAYSIQAAKNSNLFDEVMVSTDDSEIADIARALGANVPFFRSKKNSDDFATTIDVISEVINEYNSFNRRFDFGCCIYPTAPFVTSDRLKEGLELLEKNNFSTVLPVVAFSYPIFRGLKKDDLNRVSMIWPEYLHTRSQDLGPAYHDAGQWYWFDTNRISQEKSLFTDNTGSIVLPESEVQDIDTLTDWHLAELKYKVISNV